MGVLSTVSHWLSFNDNDGSRHVASRPSQHGLWSESSVCKVTRCQDIKQFDLIPICSANGGGVSQHIAMIWPRLRSPGFKAMSSTSQNSQISITGESNQTKPSGLTERPKQTLTFKTLPLPPEIRFQIYAYILSPIKRTLRRPEEHCLFTSTDLFDTSLLAVNKATNAETVPLLYASHTFHSRISRHPSIRLLYLQWLKHASIAIALRTNPLIAPELQTQIQELEKCCPALHTLTLHINSIEHSNSSIGVREAFSPQDPTAITLQTLHSRLDRLSLVNSRAWTRLDVFRQSMATEGNSWVKEILATWPLISLDILQYESPSIRFLMHREIHAYHLFGGEVAKKLREGDVENKDWVFADEQWACWELGNSSTNNA